MSWHILTIDSPQATLTCRHKQLVYRPEKGEEQSLPLEDIAAIIITGFSVHLHHSLLIQAARMGVSLIICEKIPTRQPPATRRPRYRHPPCPRHGKTQQTHSTTAVATHHQR